MLVLILLFLAWVAGSYLVFTFLATWCIVAYGVVSIAGLLVWAVTRKPGKSLNDRAVPR